MNGNTGKKIKSKQIYLSVIIPAFNESQRLPNTLNQILDYLESREYQWELIIVDDGSTDNSPEIIQQLIQDNPAVRIVKNDKNRGKGYSVKNGMMNASGEFRLFSDADQSTPITEIERFLECHHKGFDICIGSRSLPDSNVEIHQPWYRERMGKVFGLLQRIILLDKIIDSQCGFKSFNKKAAEFVFPRQTIQGFSFDVEVLHIAQKHGLKIKEIPVTWRNNPDTRVGALTDSFDMFWDLIKIRFDSWKGQYK